MMILLKTAFLLAAASVATAVDDNRMVPTVGGEETEETLLLTQNEGGSVDKDARTLRECADGKKFFRLELKTDRYGSDTSWVLRKKSSSKKWKTLTKGPPQGRSYENNDNFVGGLCLATGQYRFVISDSEGDGLCCNHGQGGYSAALDGLEIFRYEENKDWSKKSHMFRVQSSPTGNNPLPFDPKMLICAANEKKIRVEIKTDNYGQDTSWEITNDRGTVVLKNDRTYKPNDEDTSEACLQDRKRYSLAVYDTYGDGMCCDYGRGSFAVKVKDDGSWKELIRGGQFSGKVTRTFDLGNIDGGSGGDGVSSSRDEDWLVAHNVRRKQWHEEYGKTYIPLRWSDALKRESEVFAEVLLEECDLYHDPENVHGENLALNYGFGSKAATVNTADSILKRWTEDEVDLKWPQNGHLTQVLWRGSKYVGCADAQKTRSDGWTCHTQVCRYARPGNCNVGRYITGDKMWWLDPVMQDTSPCGPACPPDGCT